MTNNTTTDAIELRFSVFAEINRLTKIKHTFLPDFVNDIQKY